MLILAAPLGFAQPLLLLGILTAALPLIVHLLLKPKPQRVRFPALALLWPAFESGQRAGRVRNALLLATRMAVLAFAALLLAGPTCGPGQQAAGRGGPVAVLFLLDDSASMSYTAESGRTLAETAGIDLLARLDALANEADAQVAILHSGAEDAADARFELPTAARRRVRPPTDRPTHARTLAASLRLAEQVLAGTTAADRRLVIYTDMTARAWEDVTSAGLARIPNLRVEVVAVAAGANAENVAISAVALPTRRPPAAAAASAAVVVESRAGGDRECWLAAFTDEGTLPRAGPFPLSANLRQVAALQIPALPAGPHALSVRVEPDDRMNFDQERFIAFETGARPRAWLLTPPAVVAAGDITTIILRNLLAPDSLDAAAQLVELRIVDSGAAALSAAAPPALIVAPGGCPLDARPARAILECVERGTTLLLVPRGGEGGADWPALRATLMQGAATVRERGGATSLAWDESSPYRRPPDAAGNLAAAGVRSWLELPPLSESVVVHARFADGAPAIISKRVGGGRVVLLATSPDPAWSEIGVEAAGLLTWLHALIDESLGPPAAVAEFAVGERAAQTFSALPRSGSVRVVGPASAQPRSEWLTLVDGLPTSGWPTRVAGAYSIYAGNGTAPACCYAVNWPPAESNLTPLAAEHVERLLGVRVELSELRGSGHPTGRDMTATAAGDPRTWLGAILLAALLAEGWLAARSIPVAGLRQKEESRVGR